MTTVTAPAEITYKNDPRFDGLDFQALNAALNFYGENGEIQFDADRRAVRDYFLNDVNRNMVFYVGGLEEKLETLVNDGYYDKAVLDQYTPEFIKASFKQAYAHKHRFETYLGALKFYTSYALKSNDGQRYLERYEDRCVMVSLYLGRGDEKFATSLIDRIISGQFTPATPTLLNAGKAQRGELVSCFLLRMEDSMESIVNSLKAALQLSKRGGGVAFNLSNLREVGAPIKNMENQGAGIVPVMKQFENAFSYANQLGQRPGAGAVYLSSHHPDVLQFLATKRENADEKIRVKTLNLGIVIPDITFELAAQDQDMYLFSPYSIQKEFGVPFSDISISEKYWEMVENPRIRKTKIKARKFFEALAKVQFESGYPYVMFEDTVNRHNPNPNIGRITQSNLCTEIFQSSTASTFNEDGSHDITGRDISCNLGSLNIAKVMDAGNFGETVETAMRALTVVSEESNIRAVPSVARGNDASHSVGLGAMNLHGFLGRESIAYDSPEAIEFVSAFFATLNFHSIRASNLIARERGRTYEGFEGSKYADGSYFDTYMNETFKPKSDLVKELLRKFKFKVPSKAEWVKLKEDVAEFGLFHGWRLAVAPTGSISYINNSTASLLPIAALIEIRKEGKTGRVYFPAPHMTNDNLEYFRDAFSYGPKAIIDIHVAAGVHVDQGLSLSLFWKEDATTKTLNVTQMYAWRKGIRSLYYNRFREQMLAGTETEGCVSCQL